MRLKIRGTDKSSDIEIYALFFMALAVFLIAYYIIFPARGLFHSDCADTLLWAQASYDAKAILNPDFTYACLLPFGGQLLMLPWIGLFGVSMTTQTIGMLLFLVLFTGSVLFLLRVLQWDLKWSAGMVAILLLMISLSEKMREIFWGHIIYYSLGILFLFVGLALVLGALRYSQSQDPVGTRKFYMNLVLISLWYMLCSTNGIQALTIFVIPTIAAVAGERILNFETRLADRENYNTYRVLAVMVGSAVVGYSLGLFFTKGFSAGYANAYSSYANPSDWTKNLLLFLPHWSTLLGVNVQQGDSLVSKDGLLNFLRISGSLILLGVPVAMTVMYNRIRDRGVRIVILAHWIMTALIMFGFVYGLLSTANWRLSPIICTSTLLSVMFCKWLWENTPAKRISVLILILLVFVCFSGAFEIKGMPPDLHQDQGHYGLKDFLIANNLTYGYATFWNANVLTVISDSRVKSRAVVIGDKGVTPDYYQGQRNWYEDQPGQETYFLLVSKAEYEKMLTDQLPLAVKAEKRLEHDGFVVLVFRRNLF